MEREERGLDHNILSTLQRWAASPAQGSFFLASDFVLSLVIAVSRQRGGRKDWERGLDCLKWSAGRRGR